MRGKGGSERVRGGGVLIEGETVGYREGARVWESVKEKRR